MAKERFQLVDTPSRMLDCGILEKWHDKKWEDFTNDPDALESVYKYLDKAREARQDGVGLFLWGANGTGKSLLMALAFRHLLYRRARVKIITLSTLITRFTGSWYDKEERERFHQGLLNADFLGIEEIGKEFKSATDLGSVVLDSIVKYRIQRKLPTWATTNLDPKNVTDYYTEDIASMMRECCLPVQVTGKDFRKEIAADLKKKYL